MTRVVVWMTAACLSGAASETAAIAQPPVTAAGKASAETPLDAAAELSRALEDGRLRSLTEEALANNPHLGSLEAAARASSRRVARVGGLPDPEAMVTAYVEPPETRVGAQRLMATLSQRLPWSGKRALDSEVARHRSAAARYELEAARLTLVAEVRRLYHELAFVAAQVEITEEFRQHLVRHEEIARARYSTGRGGSQGALKLQAEITRVDRRLLDLEARRAALVARLNGKLARSPGHPAPEIALGEAREIEVELATALERALARRPEMSRAEALLDGAETEVARAEKAFKPDFMVGLAWAFVERRDDPAGLASPPPDDGQDVLGIQGGVRIPLWSAQRHAGLEESLELRSAGERAREQVAVSIGAEFSDVAERLALTWRELRLLEDQMIVQAEESLESAQSGYIAGTLNALDLFDAEHLLFETRTAVARATADYLIAVADLENGMATPIAAGGGS